MLSVFLLSIATGPLFLAPLSEMYGRSIVLQLSNLVFIIFNLACGLAQSKEQLIIFRFLAGLGGSASQTVGGGSLTDIFVHEERGKAIGIFCLAPVLGPALGPISGGYITENTSWRWVFHSVTIAAGLVQIFSFVALRETFPPLVLNKIKRERIAATGNTSLRTRWDAPRHSPSRAFRTAIVRPFRLLGTQLIVQILAIYLAFIFGVLFLVLATFSELWVVQYHQSLGTSGLNYLSMAIGLFVAAQLGSRWQDQIYITLKNRSGGHGKPEFRIPLLIPGAILVPAGLLWYAWSAERHLHWIMPNIGIALFSAGVIIEYLATQTYIVDVYTHFAASALGATSVLRNLAGFGFPLFAKHLYHRLHLGWGNSLLALIAIVLGWPAPFLLWWYGESWRKRSPFAVG